MLRDQSQSRAAYFLIIIGMTVLAFCLNNAEASEAAASIATPWAQKDVNGKPMYQDCGQDCTYQKANETLVIQSRYVQERNLANPSDQNQEAYHRLLLLKIGGALGRNSKNAADLRSTQEGTDEARDVPQLATRDANQAPLKPILPTVYESKDLAREIQNKLHDQNFLKELRLTKPLDGRSFDEMFKPGEGDFWTFRQVNRDPRDSTSDKIWTADRASGPELQKAKADYEALKPKAMEYLKDLQGKIRTKYEKVIAGQGRQPAKDAPPPTLEDFLIDPAQGKKSDAEIYHDLRNMIADGANKDMQQRGYTDLKFKMAKINKVEREPSGLGLIPQNKHNDEIAIQESQPTEQTRSVYLTDKLDHFDAAKYESFRNSFMVKKEDQKQLQGDLNVGRTRH